MNTFIAVLTLVVVVFHGAKATYNCNHLVPLAKWTLSVASLLRQPKKCNVTEDKITFYYFYGKTSRTFKIGETPFLDNNASKCCIRVFCHGWIPTGKVLFHVIQPWLDIGCGVIYLHWRYYAEAYYYLDAKECTLGVGLLLAKVLATIPPDIRDNCLHAVGFSLGGHICGIASMNVEPKLKFVTACDVPVDTDEKDTTIPISKNSADCVQFISTSDFSCNYKDVDVKFIVNGGHLQPGGLGVIYDHEQCIQYFFESITSTKQIVGTACNSYEAYMAGECINNTKAAITDYYNQTQRSCSPPGTYHLTIPIR